jgi:hypothetical protein
MCTARSSHQTASSFAFLDSSGSPFTNVLRSNASVEPDWRRRFDSLNFASDSVPVSAIAHERGNASPAMNKTSLEATTEAESVRSKALASIHLNSECVSNEIDESDLLFEKHPEQRN